MRGSETFVATRPTSQRVPIGPRPSTRLTTCCGGSCAERAKPRGRGWPIWPWRRQEWAAGRGSRNATGKASEEIADELVAWALEVDRRERTMEAEAGVQAGTLAGRLVYLPHRASIGAWLHQVGLQQVRRTFARRRGIAPSAVALDPQGGLATDDSSKPSRSPQPLVTDGREGVILGDLGSNWDACRGAVADDYLTGKELEALRLAAAVHWERARERD